MEMFRKKNERAQQIRMLDKKLEQMAFEFKPDSSESVIDDTAGVFDLVDTEELELPPLSDPAPPESLNAGSKDRLYKITPKGAKYLKEYI